MIVSMKQNTMKRNFFLFLLLFLFTVTASVNEMSHDISIERSVRKMKSFALKAAKAPFQEASRQDDHLSDQYSPMILQTLFDN